MVNNTLSWNLVGEWISGLLEEALPDNLPLLDLKTLSIDSRSIIEGAWFLPIRGENYDGHEFLHEVAKKGAAGAFVNRGFPVGELGIPTVSVSDTKEIMLALAKGWRACLDQAQFLGITGSLGKTTAKSLISHILSRVNSVFASPGNFNNEFGVALSLYQMSQEHRYGVFELGARHPKDIAVLTQIIQPHIACLLNAGDAHLEIFRSRERLLETKLEIFSHSSHNSHLIYPSDDSRIVKRMEALAQPKTSFGFKKGDIHVVDVRGCVIDIEIFGEKKTFKTPFVHSGLVSNLLACLAMTNALGVPLDDVQTALSTFKGVPGRFLVHRLSRAVVIDDAYNASPSSMNIGLKALQENFSDQEKIVILGDMREIEEVESNHRMVGRFCALEVAPVMAIAVGSNRDYICQGLVDGGMDEKHIFNFSSVEELLKYLSNLILEVGSHHPVIYLKASHAVGLGRIVKHLIKDMN